MRQRNIILADLKHYEKSFEAKRDALKRTYVQNMSFELLRRIHLWNKVTGWYYLTSTQLEYELCNAFHYISRANEILNMLCYVTWLYNNNFKLKIKVKSGQNSTKVTVHFRTNAEWIYRFAIFAFECYLWSPMTSFLTNIFYFDLIFFWISCLKMIRLDCLFRIKSTML